MTENSREDLGDPRIALAIERTYLAWVRTAIALMGFGFVVARFAMFLREVATEKGVGIPAATLQPSVWIGILLVAGGVIVQTGAVIRYRQQLSLTAGTCHPVFVRTGFGLAVAIALIVVGIVTVIQLMFRLSQ